MIRGEYRRALDQVQPSDLARSPDSPRSAASRQVLTFSRRQGTAFASAVDERPGNVDYVANVELSEMPAVFYVFVNQASPMTWHNFNLTGQFVSSSFAAATDPSTAQAFAEGRFDVLPYVRNPEWEATFVSPFMAGALAYWGVEHDAERVRRDVAPEAPSRLACTFAFGSESDCIAASLMYGWSLGEVRPFAAMPDDLLRVRRANMQIVSLARMAYSSSALDVSAANEVWSAYWRGGDDFALELPAPPPTLRRVARSGCLWEYLIDGRLQRA